MITKMSDTTPRFELILTSFSSNKCNSQFKFKIKWSPFTCAPTAEALCVEMTSSVADIIKFQFEL